MRRFKCRALPVIMALLSLFTGTFSALTPAGSIALAGTGPDLTIESITWSPQMPSIGETVTFTAIIKNLGDSPASPFSAACYIDDILLVNSYVNPVSPGSFVTYVFTWKAKAGAHMVKVISDSNDDIVEINEANNDKTYAFSVLAPDLVIEEISWAPQNPSIGDKVIFTAILKNQGNKQATASSVAFYLDGKLMGYRNIASLDIGENVTATYSTEATPGAHSIEASADALQQVRESNETNNARMETYATATPDLIIDAITWSPTNRSESDNVTITVTVRNQGSGTAAFSSLALYIDDVCQNVVVIGELSANTTSIKTISYSSDANEHTIKAAADAANVLHESDESNNAKTVTLPALAPDLIVQSITWSPEQPLIAHQMEFIVTVKNQGTRESGLFELSFQVNYFNKSIALCNSLDINATATFTFPWVTQEKTISAKAIVDEANNIKESSETNNIATVSVGISKPAPNTDLSIESIACNPADPSSGDIVTIAVKIKNSGPGEAGPAHVAYYIDNALLDSVYVSQMKAGATNNSSVTWQAEAGIHRIRAVIDCDDSVFEINENNNETTFTLTTTAPDLTIQNIAWLPANPGIGNEVTFTMTIMNRGNRKSGSSYITYYVDGSPRGNHYIEDIEAGAAIARTFTWKTQAASHIFRAVLDEADSIIESNEFNNEKTVFLPAPDLLVNDITCSPDNPAENPTLIFIISISNQGKGSSRDTRAACYLDGELLAGVDISGIDAGNTASGNFTWVAREGKHVLRVVADDANNLIEISETNNTKEVILFVPKTMVVEVPRISPVPETKPEPAPEVKTTNNTTKTGEISELSPPQGKENMPDISANISKAPPADASPWWKNLLMNRLTIIGVGAIGIAAIAVLFLLRKRASKKQSAENPPQ